VLWPDALPGSWDSALHALLASCAVCLEAWLTEFTQPDERLCTYALHVGQKSGIDREAAAEAKIRPKGASVRRRQGAWAPSNIAAITRGRPFLAGEEGDWIGRERANLHRIPRQGTRLPTEIWTTNGEPN